MNRKIKEKINNTLCHCGAVNVPPVSAYLDICNAQVHEWVAKIPFQEICGAIANKMPMEPGMYPNIQAWVRLGQQEKNRLQALNTCVWYRY